MTETRIIIRENDGTYTAFFDDTTAPLNAVDIEGIGETVLDAVRDLIAAIEGAA